MSSMVATLELLCFCTVFTLSYVVLAFAEDDHNKQFIYHGFDRADLHLDGDANVHRNGLLQLTNNVELQQGHAFYAFPFKFDKSSSSGQSLAFSTSFVFAMVSESVNVSGHGIAFVISQSLDFSEASPGSYLGLFNISNNGLSRNHVFAVELDTVQNSDYKDIDGNHVGIDVNSLISIESASAAYFSDTDGKNESLELASGKPIQVWIDYSGKEKLLNVTLAPITMRKPNRPLLSTPLDLSQVLSDSIYVGFSASTGRRTSRHYILGWSFNENGHAKTLNFSMLPSLPPISPANQTAGQEPGLIAIVLVVAVVVLLVTIGVAVYIVRKKKYKEVYEDWEREYGPHRISYKNLYKATKGFKEKELIGEGGFGKVYRGVLPDSNEQIAIKRVSHDSGKGTKQFVAEILSTGRLRHRNLVQLQGYCRRKGELLLVYDYMPNGSLDKVLYSDIGLNLNWFQRIQILRGVASGLYYLHEEWEQVILHRDVKPANVLLDADLNGKLGDFGLARPYDHGSNLQTSKLVGTVGYLAPELFRTGKATTCTDVFAFGAFMLEVACGRRPMEPGKVDLVDWVIECWKKGYILDAIDPRLGGLFAEEQMELVLKLGLFCSHPNPAARPSMRRVMQYLDGDAKFQDTSPDSTVIAAFSATIEESNLMMPFSSLYSNSFVNTMSATDSILVEGR
ncbi:hypothetical protein Ddye_024221 [Dipteronia dyeriana]|uniref:non-specific serine/threonine protein kinase n=1 Tax=Dipteronia dyeriana TaxID=168575 RepID=A0AAD9TVF3_9ROSI|nr:hypothetical protein Ddye_024221 [Dipteronia dyeriana]